MTGTWPQNEIDHIDGNKSNNRFRNLRDVTRSANNQNRRRPDRGNKSGFLGVKCHRKSFVARIRIDGKQIHLGVFSTAIDAHRAYIKAKRNLHPFGQL